MSSPTGENGYPRENREIASSPSVSEEKSPNIDNSRSNRSTEPGTNTTENATVGEIGVTANILASRLADPNRDIPDRPAKPNPTHGNAVFYLSEGETDFGRVMVITVLVEADGSSHVIAVHSQQGETISSNHPYQRIARSLVEKWQFQPAQTAGQPVASLLDVEVKLVSR
ncbi:hypothetical protein [Geitlerinema sp. PCC 9228]|uniref:energy transducer TonB n=1 Tax=Geitlerinema sp. PCC 9228 TaxID=111611 RepID=UPI0008F9880B|nr:hypothetical protein [Geitlerinema sp. PCC 9228]